MGALSKDELGFVRASGYRRLSRAELESLMDTRPGEQIYRATVERGVKVARPVNEASVNLKPGDTLSVGPVITKAADSWVARERAALIRAGFGSVDRPRRAAWGWSLRLKGLTLAGGVRTDALVLLPANYPKAAPIGFYVREGADLGGLDQGHLYDRTYHDAPDLSAEGWLWFCGVAPDWNPARHNLVSFISIVLSMFNERRTR